MFGRSSLRSTPSRVTRPSHFLSGHMATSRHEFGLRATRGNPRRDAGKRETTTRTSHVAAGGGEWRQRRIEEGKRMTTGA